MSNSLSRGDSWILPTQERCRNNNQCTARHMYVLAKFNASSSSSRSSRLPSVNCVSTCRTPIQVNDSYSQSSRRRWSKSASTVTPRMQKSFVRLSLLIRRHLQALNRSSLPATKEFTNDDKNVSTILFDELNCYRHVTTAACRDTETLMSAVD